MTTLQHPLVREGAAAAAEREAALDELSRMVEREQAGDEAYFRGQRTRYARTLARLQALAPAPCRVLDIGSHYLHQASMLGHLRYEVTGIDVALFAEAPFVRRRAAAFGVRNVAIGALEQGEFLAGEEGRYRVVVFTEILEHITFNPVQFWRRVHALLEPGGLVYVTTPNSMRPAAWLRAFGDLLAVRGRGIGIDEILGTVTYGHHWKEYSASEIRRYFGLLSSDFEVETRWVSTDLEAATGWRRQVKRALACVPPWRSDVEAVVRRDRNGGFEAVAPRLRMQQAGERGEQPALAHAATAPREQGS